jgi:hypothetical protein
MDDMRIKLGRKFADYKRSLLEPLARGNFVFVRASRET